MTSGSGSDHDASRLASSDTSQYISKQIDPGGGGAVDQKAELDTRAAALRGAAAQLSKTGVPDAARDAMLLMRWASGLDAAHLTTALDLPSPPGESARFQTAIQRRAARQPVSHITGVRAFWDREFAVSPDVLDPRPETETLVAEALRFGPSARVLDLGTGSGCLIVTLLAAWPEAIGTATDLSQPALAVALENAQRHQVADRITFTRTNWAEGIVGPFDLIVSNPPYLAAEEIRELEPEVREYEPLMALTPGGDGLGAYRSIAAAAPGLLTAGGCIMLEIGPYQARSVAEILTGQGMTRLSTVPDLDNRPRVIIARP